MRGQRLGGPALDLLEEARGEGGPARQRKLSQGTPFGQLGGDDGCRHAGQDLGQARQVHLEEVPFHCGPLGERTPLVRQPAFQVGELGDVEEALQQFAALLGAGFEEGREVSLGQKGDPVELR